MLSEEQINSLPDPAESFEELEKMFINFFFINSILNKKI